MNIIESYTFLFADSLISSLILLPNTDMVFDVMHIFGNINPYIMVLLATVGSSLGLSINYLFGRMLNFVKRNNLGDSYKYKKLMEFSQSKLVCLGLVCFVPLIGVVIPCFLGMMKVRFPKCLFWIFVGRLIYYASSFLN